MFKVKYGDLIRNSKEFPFEGLIGKINRKVVQELTTFHGF